MGGWGRGMSEDDLRPPSPAICESHDCSRLEAHRLYLLLGFSS